MWVHVQSHYLSCHPLRTRTTRYTYVYDCGWVDGVDGVVGDDEEWTPRLQLQNHILLSCYSTTMVDMMAKEERTSVMKWKSLVFVSSSPHVVRSFTQILTPFLEKLRASDCLWFLLLFNCSREIHVNQSKVKQIVVLSSIRNYSPWKRSVNLIIIESLMKTKNIIILMRQSCWYCQKLIEIILFQLTCFTKSGAYMKMYPGIPNKS